MLKYCKLSDYRLKKVIKCFCVDIEASKTAQILGINRNTINRLYNVFRQAIHEQRTQELRKLTGHVEVDETYFGLRRARGQATRRGRGTNKQPVFGIYERDGEVLTEIIPNCASRTLLPIIRGKVAPESVILSDGWNAYSGLVDMGYKKHRRVQHERGEFARERGIHINGIENFWSFTKHRLAKFKGVRKNFALHLKECEWRYKKKPIELERELIILLKRKSS